MRGFMWVNVLPADRAGFAFVVVCCELHVFLGYGRRDCLLASVFLFYDDVQ